jgi:hypothetical protein
MAVTRYLRNLQKIEMRTLIFFLPVLHPQAIAVFSSIWRHWVCQCFLSKEASVGGITILARAKGTDTIALTVRVLISILL